MHSIAQHKSLKLLGIIRGIARNYAWWAGCNAKGMNLHALVRGNQTRSGDELL